MSQLIETGFKMNYEVLNIRSIKVTPSGDMNGNKYGASVKIKTVNISQEDDEKFGLVEKETIMEFKIPCRDAHLKNFNAFLRGLQKSNTPLSFTGTPPRDAGKDSYTVTSFEDADQIMAAYQKK
ncbi:MAG: hypothetical protein P794_05025 [Epsilonproteobacteria bacterium (ex Lamellibrachia satsuma)]|nr:MAG: hypothetical protein P794_05025 [Epsilonproteobacteria bacterium (ex Lamellibrachia satsuma)]